MVLEVPPKYLGAINDYWFRWVIDLGGPGPDRGLGGKYLILPPGNWIQTIPGRGWFVLLRLYGPLEPFFDKSWRPSGRESVP